MAAHGDVVMAMAATRDESNVCGLGLWPVVRVRVTNPYNFVN